MHIVDVKEITNNAVIIARAAEFGTEIIKHIVGGSIADSINNSPLSKLGVGSLIISRIVMNIGATSN